MPLSNHGGGCVPHVQRCSVNYTLQHLAPFFKMVPAKHSWSQTCFWRSTAKCWAKRTPRIQVRRFNHIRCLLKLGFLRALGKIKCSVSNPNIFGLLFFFHQEGFWYPIFPKKNYYLKTKILGHQKTCAKIIIIVWPNKYITVPHSMWLNIQWATLIYLLGLQN